MIHFGEINKTDSAAKTDIDTAHIEEKSSVTKEDANAFWNKMFSEDIKDENDDFRYDNLDPIYGRSSDEFEFDGKLSDEVQDVLSEFKNPNWNELSFDEKNDITEKYKDIVAKSLGLEVTPEIKWIENDNAYGYFDPTTNCIYLNKSYLLNDPAEIVNTIPHELRHAFQYMRSEKGETELDTLYKLNFDNYIDPIKLPDGRYMYFEEYQDQLIEAEARAYAQVFSEGYNE